MLKLTAPERGAAACVRLRFARKLPRRYVLGEVLFRLRKLTHFAVLPGGVAGRGVAGHGRSGSSSLTAPVLPAINYRRITYRCLTYIR